MADRITNAAILAAIDTLTERNHGRSPTVRELGAAIGLTSTAATSYRIGALRRHGLLEPLPPSERYRPCTMRISPAGMLALTDAKACAA